MQSKTKQFWKRLVATLCTFSMVFTSLFADVGTLKVQAAGEHTMWLVGDSTVSAFTDTYYRPRYGYGTQIGNYVDDTYTVQNLALSGTSSKSYLSEANYTTLTNGIKEGDVLVIGFGHNDEKAEAERYTNPNGDYQTEGSFAKSLYDNYVKVAKDKGAEVILCTPIVRRTTTDSFSDSQLHITTGTDAYPGGDYPAAIRKLGEDVSVPVVDMTELTKAAYLELTPSKTLYLHCWKTSKEASVDNTHLNLYGAQRVAYILANAIKDTNTSLAAHITLDAGYPEWDAGVAATINQDYDVSQDEKEYSNDLPDSTIWEDYVVGDVHFKGTVFGVYNAIIDPTYTTIETDEDGNMHVAVRENKSKIAGSQDGFSMYYYKVPAGKQFSLSAKATINDIADNNQVGFGLMARDDMYIDTADAALITDYVAAGSLGGGSNGCNCFYRHSGTLGGKTALTTGPVVAGNVYDLNITSNSDGYVCTFGDEPAQSQGYDFQLTGVDSEYVYIGMFASRNVDVTYSSIVLTVDGVTLMDTTAMDVQKYSVTVTKEGEGSASADPVSAKTGATVTLSQTPGKGYLFKEWQVVSGNVSVSENNTFVMGTENVEIKAVFEADPEYAGVVGGPVDVWDFGGVVETDTELYTNHIEVADWDGYDNLSSKGTFSAADEIKFGDLTLNVIANDRLYCSGSDKNYGTSGLATTAYEDGYTAAGMYYANGTGGPGRRHVTIDNVKAGDKLIAYMGSSNAADGILYFEYLGEGGTQKDSKSFTNKGVKQEFVALYDGQYRFWTDSSAGKPIYNRVVRIPGVAVSGTINYGPYKGSGASVKFFNTELEQETEAALSGNSYSAKLAPGYDYTARLSGAAGYGFTIDSKSFSVSMNDVLGGKTHNLVVEEKSTFKFTGSIKGFADGYEHLKDLEIRLLPAENSGSDPVKLTIAEDLSFSATLDPEVEYTLEISGVNDYEITNPLTIEDNKDHSEDITVALKAQYKVSGGFKDLGSGKVTALSFKNVDDEYTYEATLSKSGYSISLRDGGYEAVATVDGYVTHTHVLVEGADVTKDLLFVSTMEKESLKRVADLYVGYSDQKNNYATVKEAVEAATLMNPASEEERITIHIAPGTYREQIIVSAPYISFVNDSKEEVLLTWYYGIGYKYYSADASGFYNPENAYDKFDKKLASKWGTCVQVTKNAQAFRAEGITFENSFNRYVTDEEMEDGVELLGNPEASSIAIERNYATDVCSKKATERAAAICVEADQAEFYNCAFMSSQDTVYTSGAHIYFKNCFIEGQTDYIFGSGNAVFDACELSFKGYTSGTAVGGYITAQRPAADSEKGYLFRNCTVTGNDKLEVKAGYFGRPWGANAMVSFINTKLEAAAATDLIVADGWYSMSGNDPTKANFAEYNTTTTNGDAADTASRKGGVLSAEAAAAVSPADYFGDWTPAYYTAEAEELAFETVPYVVDNGDINAPYPGHTFTVGYSLGKENDANDASLIKWYSVSSNDTKTLVKASTATVDPTYKVAKSDIGCHIMVEVTPMTVSGKTAEAKSYTVEAAILNGYEDPSVPAGEVEFGDGINIFLAGDSTVKDYSENGMYMGGKSQNEGAWGEFLQAFFDKEKVTIVNYANGGRSSRNFINEGNLDKIAANIKEGDYLFIQFGHNDCANGSGYLEDRYVPLGEPDAKGIYPVTEGKKVVTPESLKSKYGDTFYSYDCGGTYKWYLKQYVDAAKNAGAIPVLVTPVSRMYYTAEGKIRDHHDSTDTTTNTQVTTGNAYVEAVKQLASEEGVLLIDGFGITKDMFETAYAAAEKDTYGRQVMSAGDSTHNNKLGGLIEAAYIATDLQGRGLNISKAVKTPEKVAGLTTTGQTVFSINGSGQLVAYDILSDYAEEATYWEGVGQKMIDDIKAKAAGEGGSDDPSEDEGMVVRLADESEEFIYTGKAITPAVVVECNGKVMTQDVDYVVKYKNNVKASDSKKSASITVKGKGNLTGSTSISFTIQPRDLNEAEAGSVIVASGSKASPVLVYNGIKLTTKDYTNQDAKTIYTKDGSMKLVGKGNFCGELELPVAVFEKSQIKKFTVSVSKDKLVYNGSEQKPSAITVTDASTKTALDEDKYMIVYPKDITSAGSVKFSVVGLGEYTGCVTKTYKIAALKTTVTVDASAVDAEGYAFDPNGVTLDEGTLKLSVGELELVEGEDFIVKYSKNKAVGNAKYSFKFLGNYKGSKAAAGSFKIVPASLIELEQDDKVCVAAVGKTVKKAGVYKTVPYVTVNDVLLKKSDMDLTYYVDEAMTTEMSKTNPVEIGGTVYVKIVGKGKYAAADAEDFLTASYQVVSAEKSKDLSKAKIVDAKTGKALGKQAYTGSAITPEIKVMIGNTEVPAGAYELVYMSNVNKGKAVVIISAIEGNDDGYAGSKAQKFSIASKNLSK